MTDKFEIVKSFVDTTLPILKQSQFALIAIIPQTEQDKVTMRKGLEELDDLINKLENASTLREYAECINVKEILEKFDMESIRHLKATINNQSSNAINQLIKIINKDVVY